jgi:predicted DNA repair protein MutK
MVLPATESTAAACGEVIDDFAVAVSGGEAERDLPVWSN